MSIDWEEGFFTAGVVFTTKVDLSSSWTSDECCSCSPSYSSLPSPSYYSTSQLLTPSLSLWLTLNTPNSMESVLQSESIAIMKHIIPTVTISEGQIILSLSTTVRALYRTNSALPNIYGLPTVLQWLQTTIVIMNALKNAQRKGVTQSVSNIKCRVHIVPLSKAPAIFKNLRHLISLNMQYPKRVWADTSTQILAYSPKQKQKHRRSWMVQLMRKGDHPTWERMIELEYMLMSRVRPTTTKMMLLVIYQSLQGTVMLQGSNFWLWPVYPNTTHCLAAARGT